jgi:hypothetical protein
MDHEAVEFWKLSGMKYVRTVSVIALHLFARYSLASTFVDVQKMGEEGYRSPFNQD